MNHFNISHELSLKIRTLSFISIVFVVFIHAGTTAVAPTQPPVSISLWVQYLQLFISEGIARVAVPFFFLTSGFLFFLNIHSTERIFRYKFPKSMFTLIIPYLLWSLWGILFFYIFQSIPATASFFTQQNSLVVHRTVEDLLFIWLFNPVNYQLWFLRDLIFILPLTPILYWGIRKFPLVIAYFLFGLWLCNLNIPFKLGNNFIISIECLFWFTFGGILATYQPKLLECKRSGNDMLLLWFLFTGIALLMSLAPDDFSSASRIVFKKLGIIAGIVGLWLSYPQWSGLLHRWIAPQLYGLTFFIYIAHEPFVTPLKKLYLKIVGIHDVGVLSGYFLAPLATVAILLWVGQWLRSVFPNFFSIITGGRGKL